MARRKSNRNKYQSRKAIAKHPKRQENKLDKRRLIILACEDEKSARFYFEHYFELLKTSRKLSCLSCVVATHQHTDPTGVLKDLLNFSDVYGNTYKDYDHRWIVIDRDEERCGGGGHTLQNFNEALQKASKNRPAIKVAWSNPSFEVWYLLHFHYHNTAIDRDQVIVKLKQAMSTPYEKNDPDMFSKLSNLEKPQGRELAIRYGRRLHDDAKQAGLQPADTNPGTSVYELVEVLLQLRKPLGSCVSLW
ncbi:MAG: RloB family protein [Pedobacter sp.]